MVAFDPGLVQVRVAVGDVAVAVLVSVLDMLVVVVAFDPLLVDVRVVMSHVAVAVHMVVLDMLVVVSVMRVGVRRAPVGVLVSVLVWVCLR